MRKVQGTLAISYQPKDPEVRLAGHLSPYVFDKGLEHDEAVPAGTFVTLTLIVMPGPNPGNSAKTHFDVERVAGLCVDPSAVVRKPMATRPLSTEQIDR